MEKYRQPDKYYLDVHHREVIAELKELYIPVAKAFQELKDTGKNIGEPFETLSWKFRERAVELNRLKQAVIAAAMRADEEKDRLVAASPLPKKPRCATCGRKMRFATHLFNPDCTVIRFAFECKEGHAPRRAFFADGREYLPPVKKCAVCQGTEFVSSKEVNGTLLIFRDECKKCGYQEEMELDEGTEVDEPINEEERIQFVTAFENEDSPMEGLKKFLTIIDGIVKNPKMTYDTEVIKKLTIQQVEERLKKKLKKKGFKKFRLGTPSARANVSVGFSVLEATERDIGISRTLLKELIRKILFKTNWRIMQQKITSRMGLLEGKIMGYEGEFDLQRIAGEIAEAREPERE